MKTVIPVLCVLSSAKELCILLVVVSTLTVWKRLKFITDNVSLDRWFLIFQSMASLAALHLCLRVGQFSWFIMALTLEGL